MSRKESKKKSKAKIKKCGSERNAIIVKHKYLIKLNNIEKKKDSNRFNKNTKNQRPRNSDMPVAIQDFPDFIR